MSMLKNENLSFRLTVLGEGHLEGELKNLAASLEISDSILWLGKVDNVSDFLMKSDLFILSSIYEGFGMVILEAIDAGVPIICSNISTFEEILGSDYKGLFMVQNPKSLLRTLLGVPEHRREMHVQMESKKKLFDSQVMVDSINTVYENALATFKS
jgi:glycosyltransferase involved in cell wall biosynthesis